MKSFPNKVLKNCRAMQSNTIIKEISFKKNYIYTETFEKYKLIYKYNIKYLLILLTEI